MLYKKKSCTDGENPKKKIKKMSDQSRKGKNMMKGEKKKKKEKRGKRLINMGMNYKKI